MSWPALAAGSFAAIRRLTTAGSMTIARHVQCALQTGKLAEVGGHDRLGAAPHEEEQGFAAPAAGGMADDVTGAFGGGEGGLRGTEGEAVGADAEVVARERPLGRGGPVSEVQHSFDQSVSLSDE